MQITWKINKFTPESGLYKCVESESCTITIQNSTHHSSNSISNDSDWDSTIDINQKQFRFKLSLESESAPGLNNVPVNDNVGL